MLWVDYNYITTLKKYPTKLKNIKIVSDLHVPFPNWIIVINIEFLSIFA